MERFEEIKLGACSHWSNAPYKEEVEKGYVSGTALARKIALRAFASGAEWADAHPKNPWISVKDELPPFEKYVLLWNKNINEVQTQYFEKGYDIRTFCDWYHLSYWRLADFPQ
ncbi:MAG: hypothetical protein LUI85_02830 [Bacteroides sp.]|nr:hypothetical protein [Bacteroides sp.]